MVKRFVSWDKALKAAGILKSNNRNFSKEDLFENILNVWTHYGRQPKSYEMNIEPSIASNNTYVNKFGSWIKALNAFEIFVNSNEQETEDLKSNHTNNSHLLISEVSIEIKQEDKRSIPLGLRYQVLKRDRFRCVKCGRTPATGLNINLHIDHIVPFSLGGKTTFENLQATCQDCNLGKGNRDNE